MNGVSDQLVALVRQCRPDESLKPGDPRYVNCDDARGENLARYYARSIATSDPKHPNAMFFAGHLGVGKTSELLRLRKLLEDQRFTVVYFDANRQLDVNDLDFPDLLALVADESQKQLKDAGIAGFDAMTTYLRRVGGELKTLLTTRITLTEVSADTGFGGITAELQKNPSNRQIIREAVERLGTQLLNAVNDLLSQVVDAIRKEGRPGLVLIVDGLDKIQRRIVDDAGTTTHDRLFIHRCRLLASLQCHTVYTVPISLLYSPNLTQIEQAFGELGRPLPMIRLRGPDKGEITPDTLGMKTMREILLKRCEAAKINRLEDALDPQGAELICRASGGHPRVLMTLVQAACNEVDDLPVTLEACRQAVRRYANSLFRQLPDAPDYLGLLKRFDTPQSNIPRDDLHQQMLYLLHVYEYMNGQPYFEVNPVFRDIPSYQDARPVP